MCGVTAILNKGGISSSYLQGANEIVRHRGPDDEGYLLWSPGQTLKVLSGNDTATETMRSFSYEKMLPRRDWQVGLGHRRLSILDLTSAGHQPMVLADAGLTVTFNGEIYNYLEIRQELQKLGRNFSTRTDTEVILHAWAQWGPTCLNRFNGMFAFVLLDANEGNVFAVRDRFGVKPLYFTDSGGYLAFVSEVKQLRVLPEYTFDLNHQVAYDYLRYGFVDHSEETFENRIHQVNPGTYIQVDVRSHRWTKKEWYSLKPKEWKGSDGEAFEMFYLLLKDSIRLRIRSDVPVGSALSGGLDSSTIVCLMREVFEDQAKSDCLIKTITSCSTDKKYDEWEFAERIIEEVGAESFKVFPSFEKFQSDLGRIIWHLDYPFGSTSQFSQWCVFEEAKRRGLTVMIDGQGADEQLAGYGGNDLALYAGLLRRGKLHAAFLEAKSYHSRHGRWPVGFLLGAAQVNFSWISSVLPKAYQTLSEIQKPPAWIKADHFTNQSVISKDLQENLLRQVGVFPLPSLLRYEDRNSMAFSVESRVPFMDYRLLEFTLGLPEALVYRKGERKYILRKSLQNVVPDKILCRTDKMGFVSAEERWLKEDGREWFETQMEEAVFNGSAFIRKEEMKEFFKSIREGSSSFDFAPWRVVCFNLFLRNMINGRNPVINI